MYVAIQYYNYYDYYYYCMHSHIIIKFTFTASQCSENMIYHQCGSLCQKTCNDITITKCQSGCAEGCFCLDGLVVDDHGKCRSSCPGKLHV